MSKRMLRECMDTSFGIPVKLQNVPVEKIAGEQVRDIQYLKLERQLLMLVAEKPFRLSGKEVRFIRKALDKSLEEFAGLLGVTHPGVIRWESKRGAFTKMAWSTEKQIRLEAYRNADPSPSAFAGLFDRLKEAPPIEECEYVFAVTLPLQVAGKPPQTRKPRSAGKPAQMMQ
ncbi:MAG: hypothetical protein HYZ00_12410 [Candidatus Hydrogenedentes bacterium]|nr:hypothetical protein [Candidatus Hydrogenedentota bacterium]